MKKVFKSLERLHKNKKGAEAINTLIGFGIGVVIVFVVFVAGTQVFTDLGSGFATGTVSSNIVNNASQTFLNAAKLGPVLGTIAMIVVIVMYILKLRESTKKSI